MEAGREGISVHPLLVSAALLASCATGPERSTPEAQPVSSWATELSEGRREALFLSVETARISLVRDTEVRPLHHTTGDTLSVPGEEGLHAALRTVESFGDEDPGARFCALHMHTVGGWEQEGFMTRADADRVRANPHTTFSIPPSEMDVSFQSADSIRATFSGTSFDYETNYVRAAMTPAGLWYFRPLSADELGMLPDSLQKHIQDRRVMQERWALQTDRKIATLDVVSVEILYGLVFEEANRVIPVTYTASSAIKRTGLRGALLRRNQRLLDALPWSSAEQELQASYAAVDDPYGRELGEVSRLQAEYARRSLEGPVPAETVERLTAAYQAIGSRVRFVPFEDALREPPCYAFDGDPFVPSPLLQ